MKLWLRAEFIAKKMPGSHARFPKDRRATGDISTTALADTPFLRSIAVRTDAAFDADQYPYSIPAVKALDLVEFHPNVTFFVGENGAGKSTILEAIAVSMGFGPEGGTKNVRLRTTESVSSLHESIRLTKTFRKPKDGYFLRAESLFNVATYMDEVGYLDGFGGKSLHARSHGEAFMALLTDKFRGKGLYLLDEPEAALSPNRQLAALSAIHQLVLDESQFIIATHSPILMAYPNARILQFDATGITEVQYEDTEHHSVTRDFLNDYPRWLGHLLADD